MMNAEELKVWWWDQLRQTMQALAQPADFQLGRYPEPMAPADELALDFSDAFEGCLDNMSGEQRQAATRLHSKLAEMSGPTGLWSDESLRESKEWKEVRSLARRALDVFGWPNEPPAPLSFNISRPGVEP